MKYIVDHIPRNTPCNRRPSIGVEWKDVEGYEGHYQVSCFGDIKSLGRTILMKNGRSKNITEKIIPWKFKSNGYYFVQLHKNGKPKNMYIHRLVAEHFIPNPLELSDVNHKNGDKGDNFYKNLEWTTHSQNLKHAYRTGLKKSGEEHQQAKLSKADVLFIRQNYKPFDSQFGAKPLAKMFGVGKATISTIARNLKRKHG